MCRCHLRESLAELKRRADEANLLRKGGSELGSGLLEYSREQLLPAYLQPASDDERLMALRVNGVVCLTRAAGSDFKLAKR